MTSVRVTIRHLEADFTIEAGVTAIFGPNGAGKSLLLDTIAGFERPQSGRILLEDAILFDGASGVHLAPQQRGCALVPAVDSLFPNMTPRQNLMFAAQRWPRLERHRRVAEMVEKLHLTDDAPAIRWTIARALVAEPKLLLIDDPGLDATTLREIRQNTAAPIVLASRNLDLCCSADRMLVLDSGRILQTGVPRQVVEAPESAAVARLVGIPNVFEATLDALDPGRNQSTLQAAEFSLEAQYAPGHFRGDRVWVAVAAEALVVHSGDAARGVNYVPLEFVRAVPRAQSVMLEFSSGVFVSLSNGEYARQQDNKSWLVEFPPAALRIL